MKKIKKIAQSIGVLGKVLNAKSNSKENTYSCDYLNQNYITAGLSSDFSSSTRGAQKLNLVKFISNGSKFTIENGGVKIGAGISRIKVSAQGMVTDGGSGATQILLQLYKNDQLFVNNGIYAHQDWLSVTLPPLVLDVEEGDIIYLYVGCDNSPQTIYSRYNSTNLYVEEMK